MLLGFFILWKRFVSGLYVNTCWGTIYVLSQPIQELRAAAGAALGGHCLARSARSASQIPKHVIVLGSPPVEPCINLPSKGIADGLGCSVIAGVDLLEKNGKVWQPPFCPLNCKVQHTRCNPGPLCVSSAAPYPQLPRATTEIHRKKTRVWPCLTTSALVCQKWGKT